MNTQITEVWILFGFPEKLHLDHPDHKHLSPLLPQPEQARRLRAGLGIGETDFVWLMSGTTSDRKGFDFFPDLALLLNDPRAVPYTPLTLPTLLRRDCQVCSVIFHYD